jgi:PAS domain S-box-containing protein
VSTAEVDPDGLERQLAELAVPDGEALEVLLRLAEAVFPGVSAGDTAQLEWPAPSAPEPEPDGRAGDGRSGDGHAGDGQAGGDGHAGGGQAGGDGHAGGDGDGVADHDRLVSRVRQSETRFRSLVEQLPAVVFHAALGEQDNEVYVSPQIESLLGFTQEEWLTNPLLWYSQLHPDDHDVVIEAFTRGVQTGGPFRAEVRFLSRDGKEVWILGEARLIRDDKGRLAYFQGVGFDITPSKQAQQALAQAERAKAEAARLRADAYSAANVELAELNEQLREAEAMQRAMLAREHEVVERLTQLDRDKTDFVSSVTHELRTPVTSMLGYLELLDDGDAGPLNPSQQRMLEAIERNSRRLLSRIEDLLTVSGVEAGAMRLRAAPVSVQGLVESATSAMVPTLRGRDLELAVDVAEDAGVIVADAEKLDRVLINLLSNAIKFTPDGGRISVSARREGGERLVLTVADTGLGIPVEEQPRVFERFFRSSTAQAMAIPGTGLGLVIVQGIVALHRGSISLSSVPEVGTEVTVTIPVAPR